MENAVYQSFKRWVGLRTTKWVYDQRVGKENVYYDEHF